MYNVKATRNEDGSYTLSYGKGAKKLTARLDNVGGKWSTTGDFLAEAPSKREAMEVWGKWAESSYGGSKPAADAITEDDDLTDWQRDFFSTMSQKRGRLTDWQRSQLRSLTRDLSGAIHESPVKALPGQSGGPPVRPGPPRYSPPAKVQGPPPQAGVPDAGEEADLAEPAVLGEA